MFEIKYDRDGNPIREKQLINEFDRQAQAEAAPVQHFPQAEEPQEQEQAEQIEDVTQGTPDETQNEQEVGVPPTFSAPEPEPESAAKKSFRELSAAKKRAERERDEYLRRLEELERRSQPKEAAAPEEDEDFHLGEDDIAEGKHIAKVDKRAQKKIRALEERLARYETQNSQERAEANLRAKYPDFDKVVSMDNVALLSEAYPELARTIQSNDDLYTKAVSAYTMIKKFGIYQESPFNSEKAVALKNVAKPRPLTSVSPQQGDSPLGRANAFANGLTDDLKAQLLKEMQASRKSY